MCLRTAACAFAALLATCGHPVAAQSLGGALTFSYAPEASNALQRVGVGLYQLPPGRFGFYTNGAGTFVDTEPFYDTLSETSFSPPDPTLTLELDGDALHIRGEDSHFKVYGQSPSDFPPVPAFADEADFEILAGELTQIVQQTIYATARENSRYAINGVQRTAIVWP